MMNQQVTAIVCVSLLLLCHHQVTCWSTGSSSSRSSSSNTLVTKTRREALCQAASSSISTSIAAGLLLIGAGAGVSSPQPALAFDGKGSSTYSGKNPASKAAQVKSYRDRIVADVKDFKVLGQAIDDAGKEGSSISNADEWIAFFITYPRREPDAVGRTYAARVDLVGLDPKSGGGAALLLANSYAKPNKPPDNLPQYKAYSKLSKAITPIQVAGEKGDTVKAKAEWTKASAVLQEYLASVELPESLSDALYK